MNYIYKISNNYNNKIYIGLTNDIERRMYQHKIGHDAEHSAIDRAILKHGWENFSYEIIDKSESREQIKQLEQLYIQQYDSYLHGYNCTLGGDDVVHLIDVKGEKNPRAQLTEEDVKQIRIRRMNGERLSDVYEDYKEKLLGSKRDGFSKVWLHESWPEVCAEFKDKYPPVNSSHFATKRRNELSDSDMVLLTNYFKWHGPVKYNTIYANFKNKIDWQSFQETCKGIVSDLYGDKGHRRTTRNNGVLDCQINQYRKELLEEPII